MTDGQAMEAKPRSRRIYWFWGTALGLLFALGAFCWLVVAPVWRPKIGPVERTIDALTLENAVLTEDGAAGTSPFIENIDGMSSMKTLVAMGPKAVPVLIDHLDDVRPTGLRSPRWGTRRVGDLCLQLLWRIIKTKDKAGTGRDLWFDTKDPVKEMVRAKRAWQLEYYKPGSQLREKNVLENEVNPWL